jgi:hypothetical protein
VALGTAPEVPESSENWRHLKGMTFGWMATENRPANLNPVLEVQFAEAASRYGLTPPSGVIDAIELGDSAIHAIARFGNGIALGRRFFGLVGEEEDAERFTQIWAELVHSPYTVIDATDPAAAARLGELAPEPVTVFIKNLPGSELAARSELRTGTDGTQLLSIDGVELAPDESAALVVAHWPDQSAAPASWGRQVGLVNVAEPDDGSHQPFTTYFAGPALTEPFTLDVSRVLTVAQALANGERSYTELKQFTAAPAFAELAADFAQALEQRYQHFGAAPSEEQVGATLLQVARTYCDQYYATDRATAVDQASQWMGTPSLAPLVVDEEGYRQLAAALSWTFNRGGLKSLDAALEATDQS